MSVLDLVIIYLACGSPFGVYQITGIGQLRAGNDWIKAAATWLLWPIYAFSLLTERIFATGHEAEKARLHKIENLRVDLERVAFGSRSILSIFEFRDVLYRFVGLTEAARFRNQKSEGEVFKVTNHPNRSLATRCLARKNQEKIASHSARARSEFTRVIVDLATRETPNSEITQIAAQLADAIGDPTFSKEINTQFEQVSASKNNLKDRDFRKSQPRKETVIN